VPQNGEINENFGVYMAACCGAEIVITAGVEFPMCPNHTRLTTYWILVSEEPTCEPSANKKSNNPAA
jgi:hypothetical protein